MPGFIEAHGHPLMEAIALSDRHRRHPPGHHARRRRRRRGRPPRGRARGAAGAYLNGWDALLQSGLPEPTLAWLDDIAPDGPLVIIHNSGHKAFFNSHAAQLNGLTRDTPDPKGAKYGRDANGELDGTAEEIGAVFPLLAGAIQADNYPAMLLAECARLNRAGLTTCSEMAFDPNFRPLVEQLRDELTVRLRTYEVSNPQMSTDRHTRRGRRHAAPGRHQDLGRRLAVDRQHRAVLSLPGHRGHPDHRRARPVPADTPTTPPNSLREIVGAYFPLGWQMACHVQGDAGVDTILDVYEEALRRNPRDDHRLRLEHVGAIRPEQLQRAADLGVTCSIFVDQIHYWGDVIVDGLFGPERGSRWMPAGSAVATGMRISLHNDPPVTPEEPLRNISVAVTRTAPSGRVLAPEERLTVEQAIRAQTIDAAWQLFADDVVGSLEVGKYADLVVLSADPAHGAARADRRPRRACDVSGGPPGLRPVRPAPHPVSKTCWSACMWWRCRCGCGSAASPPVRSR